MVVFRHQRAKIFGPIVKEEEWIGIAKYTRNAVKFATKLVSENK